MITLLKKFCLHQEDIILAPFKHYKKTKVYFSLIFLSIDFMQMGVFMWNVIKMTARIVKTLKIKIMGKKWNIIDNWSAPVPKRNVCYIFS